MGLVSVTLERRLKKLEASQQASQHQRWCTGLDHLLRSMEPEDVERFQSWMHEQCGGSRIPVLLGETFVDLLQRLQPPALVRAVWVLMAAHVQTGAPVSLATAVADVYLNDPDAWPTNACEGCGYLLPTRSTLRPDGSYRHIATYEGICPVCERDSRGTQEVA
jgi:hypothetical protein